MSTVIDQEMAARGVAQVIVVLRPENAPAAAARAAPSGTTAAADVAGPARGVARHFVAAETSQMSQLVQARHAGARTSARRASSMRLKVDRRQLAGRYFPHLGVMFGTVNASGLKALRRDPRVETVSGTPAISLIRPTHKAEANLTQRLTWGLRAMKVDRLWRQGLTGRGVLVGHLDTGADGTHPALAGAISGFAEFDDLGREVRPAPRPHDTDDHGTHTAATIAGRPVRGRAVGVAPGATLASAIVIEGGDVVARVLGGMDWAVGRGVRILSMSLGFRGYWDDFVPIMRVLRRRNVLPIFAVGNEGPGTSRSPGNYAEAISVGAHDRRKRVADFSSSQRFQRSVDAQVPDLVLPGVGVISARPGGGFQTMDGTSMATPHMAGLAALLVEAHPDRSLAAVETAIFGACARPPGMLVTRGNRGIPDALKALDLLGQIRVGDPSVLDRADRKPRPKRSSRPRPAAPAPPVEQRVDD